MQVILELEPFGIATLIPPGTRQARSLRGEPADLALPACRISSTRWFRNPDQGGNATLFKLGVSKARQRRLFELGHEVCEGFKVLMGHLNKISKYNQDSKPGMS